MIFERDPVPKPRMTQRDKWKRRPVVLAYRDYCDDIRALAMAAGWEPSGALYLRFVVAMPSSWPKYKKEALAGEPHQERPDIDNYVKAFLDAFGEDKTVWKLDIEARWAGVGEPGHVEAVNLEVDP